MDLVVNVWRQRSPKVKGEFETYTATEINEDLSFLEMLDKLNEDLAAANIEPIAFEHDCREGICGSCGFMINGQAHGPKRATATCQLHMREFSDGDELTLEPFRSSGFPVIKDLVVDRSAFDRIIEAGGYVSVNTGNAPDANAVPVPRAASEEAFDAAACIGCGACVAACPNGAAHLFTGAKASHLNALPQGQPERYERTADVVEVMEEFFGSCTNMGECTAACPEEIPLDVIAALTRDYRKAKVRGHGR